MRVLQIGNQEAFGEFDFELEGDRVVVQYTKPSPAMSFSGNDVVIIPRGLSLSSASPASPDGKAELNAFLVRLENARRSGVHVCVILDHWDTESDLLLQGLLPPGLKTTQADSDSLLSYNQQMDGLASLYGRPSIAVEYIREALPRIMPVLTAERPLRRIHGVVDTSLRGFLYVLPVFPVAGDERRFVQALTVAVYVHATRLQSGMSAAIVEDFIFSKEDEVRNKRVELTEELEIINNKIDSYAKKKSILTLRDNALSVEVPKWLENNLGLKTRRVEEYIEDFWLLELGDGEDVAIAEVKASTQNAQRKHVASVLFHREERGKQDDYPTLLVINSFANAKRVAEKDKQGIGPKVLSIADRNNVLIIRTLDLVRLADLLEQERVASEEIQALVTSNCGWLQVDREFNVKVIHSD